MEPKMNLFVEQMNKKAKDIGMSHSTFKNPTGLTEKGQLTTSYDVALLLLHASLNPIIVKIWKKEEYTVTVHGVNHRKIDIKNTVYKNGLGDDYEIIGGKTGTLGFIKNLSVLIHAKEQIYLLTILKAKENRFKQAKMIMDNLLKSGTKNQINANAYTVIQYPSKHINLLKTFKPDSLISKNQTEKSNPASITKLLTIITALEYPVNLNDKIKIQNEDITEDFLNSIIVDDVITLFDAFHLMLLSSSNILANAIARHIVEKYIQ